MDTPRNLAKYLEHIKLVSSHIGGVRPSKDVYDKVRVEKSLDICSARSMVKRISWVDLCKSAGFETDDVTQYLNRGPSDSDLRELVKSTYRKKQKPLGSSDFKTISPLVFSRRYGGLRKLCNDLNIPHEKGPYVPHTRQIKSQMTNEEMISFLRNIHTSTNRPLSYDLIKQNNGPCSVSIINRFGGLERMCIEHVVPYLEPKNKASDLLDKLEECLDLEIKREATFEWLINPETGFPLKCDGFIEEYNILIEIDGASHYDKGFYKRCFIDESKFDGVQRRDATKNRLSKLNGYTMARFRYPIRLSDIENNLKLLITQLKELNNNV